MKIYFFILCTLSSLFCVEGHAEVKPEAVDTAHVFLKANEAYVNSDFMAAVSYYENIISSGIINGDIFYNLGNSYLKTGETGKAILNYRKAELFIPRDEDLQANLKYAYGLVLDNIECKELVSFLGDFCFWYSKLTVYELLSLFLVLNFLLWSLLAIRLFYKGDILKTVLYLNIFLLLLIGPSAGLKIYRHYFIKKGVVTAKEILVRSGSTINSTVLFKLHDGTELEWVEENEGWVKIRLCDNKKGWVQRKVVGCVTL
jgi:tetratricopeptide (TPR) repeat protein